MYKKILNNKEDLQHNKDLHIQELELLETDELDLNELEFNSDVYDYNGIYTEAELKNILEGNEEIHYSPNENKIIFKSNGSIDHINSGIFQIYSKKVIKTK